MGVQAIYQNIFSEVLGAQRKITHIEYDKGACAV
jgi:hypothetical protein